MSVLLCPFSRVVSTRVHSSPLLPQLPKIRADMAHVRDHRSLNIHGSRTGLQVAINIINIVSLPGDLVSQVYQQYKHVRDGADKGAVDRVSSPGRENVSVLGSQVRLHTRSR